MEKKKKFRLALAIVVFFILTLISHVGLVSVVSADPVSFETAQTVAENWMKRVGEYKEIEEGIVLQDDGRNKVGYLFNFFDGGFVVVPADDIFEPVKAWSRRGFFRGKSAVSMDMETLVKRSLRQQRSFLEKTARTYSITDTVINAGWEKILNEESPRTNAQVVGPLLTTEWGQGYPYNAYCPFDPLNDRVLSVTGCTNTAMAQILRYWEWPKVGTGSKCYSFCPDFDCSNPEVKVCANFEHSYNWEKMPKTISEDSSQEEIDAIARLMADLGVLSETIYSSSASWGALGYLMDGLSTYFGYSDELEINYDREDNFFPIIKNQLEKKYPVSFSSNSHAYVADGYRIDLGMNQTHFNFGWDGYSDGWYTSEELDDFWDPSIEDNVNVAMIINIHPEGSDFPKPFLYVESTGFCEDNTPCYSTIQTAIDSASFGAIIKIAEGRYSENLNLNSAKEIILSGGWDSGFSTQLSNTVINSLAITSGTVEIENMVLQ